MIIKTDKDKLIDLKTYLDGSQYKISAKDLNGKVLGFANFKKLNKDEIWLYQIATFSEFQNNGIGSSILDILDFWTCDLGCKKILGKFSPSTMYAENFYYKNGYKIYQVNYCLILEKNIDKKTILKNTIQKYKTLPKIETENTKENNNKQTKSIAKNDNFSIKY